MGSSRRCSLVETASKTPSGKTMAKKKKVAGNCSVDPVDPLMFHFDPILILPNFIYNHIYIYIFYTGWWLTYPSQKYESQMGVFF